MSRMMIQAAVTMGQLQHKLDVIGHNLANSQTTGYKSRQVEFSSLLFQQINNMTHPANQTGRLTPDGIRVGSGAKLGPINMNLKSGALIETERPLDVALINPQHMFAVQVTEGGVTETRYTRDGAFYLNPTGNHTLLLTTKDGHPVLGTNGPIEIAEGFDSVTIGQDGQILVQRGQQTEIAGTLLVYEVYKPRVLEAVGENFFRLPNLAELGYNNEDIMQLVDEGMTVLRSGSLESSNVDLSEQMTELILTQRSYQLNARTISMGDQMLGLINQLR